ncbi:MAG: hypothetical protein AAF479_10010 [Pseudomonadota bacterium]
MYLFQIAGDVDLSEAIERLSSADGMDFVQTSVDQPIYMLHRDVRTATLTITGGLNLIDAGSDDEFAALCLRHVAVGTGQSIVFSHDQDETEQLLVLNDDETPEEVLENGAVHTGPDEAAFHRDFSTMQSLMPDEMGELPPSERLEMHFVDVRTATQDTPAELPQDNLVSLQFYIVSTRKRPLGDTDNISDPAIEVVHQLDDELIGVFAAGHEIILDRIVEHDDDTFGYWGRISGFFDGTGDAFDGDVVEAEQDRLTAIARAWVSAEDFEVAIDAENQAADSMLVEGHPGEWMTVFIWDEDKVREEKRFFPRSYD